jgi:hypothetical protein
MKDIEGFNNKVPCTCPKGGMVLTPEGGERVCDKCGGSQWVENQNKSKEKYG